MKWRPPAFRGNKGRLKKLAKPQPANDKDNHRRAGGQRHGEEQQEHEWYHVRGIHFSSIYVWPPLVQSGILPTVPGGSISFFEHGLGRDFQVPGAAQAL